MKIHTDKLTNADLYRTRGYRVYLEVSEHRSRSRARRFDVALSADPGSDPHGIRRCYARNTGRHGAAFGGDRAATWVEWGDWICALFRIDPAAIIGPYAGADDFCAQTLAAAQHRPARENAGEHVARWADALGSP